MKRLIISIAVVVVLISVIANPAFAGTGSQTWKLDSLPANTEGMTLPLGVSGIYQMQNVNNFEGQTGSVSIPPLEGFCIWLADEEAAQDVTFPYGRWDIDLITDPVFGDALLRNESGPMVVVGDFDPETGYLAYFAMRTVVVIDAGNPADSDALETVHIEVQAESATVPAGHYLVLGIENRTVDAAIVYTGLQDDGKNLPSCVTSPQTDPGYPVPEVAAGALFGIGIAGIGTVFIVRRKQALAQSSVKKK